MRVRACVRACVRVRVRVRVCVRVRFWLSGMHLRANERVDKSCCVSKMHVLIYQPVNQEK